MGKTVFISGASSGFGAALASLYAKAGDAVVLAARRMDRLESNVRQIAEDGGKALAVQCDVTNRQNVFDAVRQGEEAFGPVDLMIANAGIIYKTKAHSFSGEAFEKTMRVNLLGAAYCFEAVLPAMIERNQGHLVGVSSLAGYRGLPGALAYCSSKAALTNLMESLRVELSRTKINVTTISPGFVKTEMTASNPDPMPFLLELDEAARRIYRAIARKKKEYLFPWPLSFLTRFGSLLPNAIYDPLAGYFHV